MLTLCSALGSLYVSADNRDIKFSSKEPPAYVDYKVIIHSFISKDKTISMRNIINLHTIRDDLCWGTLKFVSKIDDIQKDTLGVSVSKKKAPAKGDRGKGMKLLSDAALLEAAQVKEALKETHSWETHKVKLSGLKEWCESKDDDGNSDADDNERTDSDDDDENPSFTLKDYDEEEHDKENESDDNYENVFEEEDDDVYKDVDARSLGAEHEKERKCDEEMTDSPQKNQDSSTLFFTVPEMAIQKLLLHMLQFFSILGNGAVQLNKADHSAQPPRKSVKSILPTMVDDLLSTRIGYATRTALQSYTKELKRKLKNTVVLAKSSSQPQSTYEAAASLTEFELKKIPVRQIGEK
ncbi:hypothetical protein Tco_0425539 [Tanacetum coccineum]